MPTPDGRGSPEVKQKMNFQQELRSTLKDRKRRGLTTGFSDTGDDDDSSSEGGALGADDDFLSQFSQKPKSNSSLMGSSKGWQPPSLGSRKASPKPSPRGSQSPSPRTLGSLKLDSPRAPTPRARTRSIDKPEDLPTGKRSPRVDRKKSSPSFDRKKSSPSLDRKKSSPSPDPILALLGGDSAKSSDKYDMPRPKPRKRTSTGGSTDSPRSGGELSWARSDRSRRPMPKPRGMSPRSKPEEPSEIDKLLGITSSKSESKRKTSNVDDLLGIKPRSRDVSPSSREERNSPYDKILGKKKGRSSSPESGKKSSSPIPKQKSHSSSPEPKSKSRSALDELVGNAEKQLSDKKSRSRSPLDELLGGKSRSKSPLDELLSSGSKIKVREGTPEITSEKPPRSRTKMHKGSPVPSRRNRSPAASHSEVEEKEDHLTRKIKGGRGSPGLKNRSRSPDADGRESPAIKLKNKPRKGLLDSSDDDSENDENNAPQERKKTILRPKPRPRSSTSDRKSPKEKPKKSTLLASDSDSDEVDQSKKKLSLLDALGDDKGKGDGKRERKKAAAKALLDDSDEEDEYDDVFGKEKNPPTISGRRPKEGYHSADSDPEDEEHGKKKSRSKVVKPTPKRPMSALVPGDRTVDLDASFNSTLSSLGRPGSTDIVDSSTIREAIFEDWRIRKEEEMKKKKLQERKKQKEEEKNKEMERNDKRRDAKLAFEAWKDNKKDPLKAKKKEEKKKRTKKEEEEHEQMMKKVDARKAYESWKQEKDEVLKEQLRKKKKQELMKTRSLTESKREKEKDSQSAFNRWKSNKDEYIEETVKDKRRKERAKQREEEESRRRQEEENMRSYQDWEESLEQRKKQERWRRMRSQPLATAPFKPCSTTIPYGR
ncbi:uncharacterized protein [Amphiura filiformis]|uniref:uncharacterized protein n=1 Tax=Amphiura filiformis TaxID=82378 RepID=UPI003B22772E